MKKLLILILCLMFVHMGSAYAEHQHGYDPTSGKCPICTTDIVAEVSGVYYVSFQDAVNAWNNGTTLRLLADAEYRSLVEIALTAGSTRTFDGNGHTLTINQAISNNGKLIVAGGSIVSEKSCFKNEGTLTIQGGTLSTTGLNDAIVNNGELTITGGTISTNANIACPVRNNSEATLILSGGTLAPEKGYGLHNEGTATFSGGQIFGENKYTRAVVNAGSLTIENNASVTTYRGIENSKTLIIAGGSITVKDDVIVNRGNATISGGTLVSTVSDGLWNSDNGVMTIRGDVSITAPNCGVYNTENAELIIEGGLISSETDAIDNYGKLTLSGGELSGNLFDLRYRSGTLRITGGIPHDGLELVYDSTGTGNVTIGNQITLPNKYYLFVNDEIVTSIQPNQSGIIRKKAAHAQHTQNPVYTDNGNDTHTVTYPCCDDSFTEQHTGGTASCVQGAICSKCHATYTAVDPNKHNWLYTANGATLSAVCQNHCGNSGSLTLAAPSSTIYDSTEKSVSVNGEIPGITTPSVTYSGSRKNAGTLTASISLGGTAATIDVVISKAKVTVSNLNAVDRAYDGTTDVALSSGTLIGKIGSDDLQLDFSSAKASMTDANAGENKQVVVTGLKLGGTDAGNYELTSQTVNTTVNITKAHVSAPEGITAVYGQKLSDVRLPDGWTWADPNAVVGSTGNNTYTANYVGDINHSASSNVSISVQVTQSATALSAELGQSSYTYGEDITINVTPTATGTSAYGLLKRLAAPEAGQISLWNGDKQLTAGMNAEAGQTVTLKINTVEAGFVPGTYTLTVRYEASNSMAAQQKNISFKVSYADNTPDASVSGKEEKSWYVNNPILTAPNGYLISTNQGSDAVWTSKIELLVMDGAHEYEFFFKNTNDGTISKKRIALKADQNAPEVTYSVRSESGELKITVDAKDAGSGIQNYVLTHDHSSDNIVITDNGNGQFTVFGLMPEEKYVFSLCVTDAVGHETNMKITWEEHLVVDLPKTGDNSQIGMWLAMLALAGTTLMVLKRKTA